MEEEDKTLPGFSSPRWKVSPTFQPLANRCNGVNINTRSTGDWEEKVRDALGKDTDTTHSQKKKRQLILFV